MKCIVSGGRGFIGRSLVDSLASAGHEVAIWSREPAKERRPAVASFFWDPLAGEPAEESLAGCDAVVHLAGEPVALRWTPEAKRRIYESRVGGTRRLVEAIAKRKGRPSTLVSASAIGYYGARGDELVDESSEAGSGFLADVCRDWESEARGAEALGLRVVIVRIGIVLGRGGGALERMLPPFRAFLGGRLGSGRQWMSWIALADVVGMLRYVLDHDVRGVWNGTAPNPVTNAEFTAELGKALGRPAFLPVPSAALRLMVGEMAEALVTGARVLPKAAQRAGFAWRYPDLADAIRAALPG